MPLGAGHNAQNVARITGRDAVRLIDRRYQPSLGEGYHRRGFGLRRAGARSSGGAGAGRLAWPRVFGSFVNAPFAKR
jgi:hypothetical protein